MKPEQILLFFSSIIPIFFAARLTFKRKKIIILPRTPATQPLVKPTSEGLTTTRVQFVSDGDTIIVVSDSNVTTKIRLDAIDCPEDGQAWGDQARDYLLRLIGGREVYLESHGFDRYGRNLATVYVMHDSELINVNERMVMLGHAWVLVKQLDHLSTRRQRQLKLLERWAKSKRKGLWDASHPTPPWEWRRRVKVPNSA